MEQQIQIPDQDSKHVRRLNSFFWIKLQILHEAPNTQNTNASLTALQYRNTLILIVPAKSSPLCISPKFPQTSGEIFLWKCCIVPQHIAVGRNETQNHCFIFWPQTPTLSLLLKVREIFWLHHTLCELSCIASSYTFYFKLLLGALLFNTSKICVICDCSQTLATSASQLGGPVLVEINTPCVKHNW